jgi:hypothetical protein
MPMLSSPVLRSATSTQRKLDTRVSSDAHRTSSRTTKK